MYTALILGILLAGQANARYLNPRDVATVTVTDYDFVIVTVEETNTMQTTNSTTSPSASQSLQMSVPYSASSHYTWLTTSSQANCLATNSAPLSTATSSMNIGTTSSRPQLTTSIQSPVSTSASAPVKPTSNSDYSIETFLVSYPNSVETYLVTWPVKAHSTATVHTSTAANAVAHSLASIFASLTRTYSTTPNPAADYTHSVKSYSTPLHQDHTTLTSHASAPKEITESYSSAPSMTALIVKPITLPTKITVSPHVSSQKTEQVNSEQPKASSRTLISAAKYNPWTELLPTHSTPKPTQSVKTTARYNPWTEVLPSHAPVKMTEAPKKTEIPECIFPLPGAPGC